MDDSADARSQTEHGHPEERAAIHDDVRRRLAELADSPAEPMPAEVSARIAAALRQAPPPPSPTG
jgi:hypothetical protein